MFDKDEVPPDDFLDYWETRDGRLIKYTDMTDTHLINSYNMMERLVCDFLNRCANRNEEQDLPDCAKLKIEALEKEIKRRKLKIFVKTS